MLQQKGWSSRVRRYIWMGSDSTARCCCWPLPAQLLLLAAAADEITDWWSAEYPMRWHALEPQWQAPARKSAKDGHWTAKNGQAELKDSVKNSTDRRWLQPMNRLKPGEFVSLKSILNI